ncbi:hypothetical protein QQM39_00175 [Streptomyces sp. DT2A-34]|uniref:hypothetical protein n=1 Tax=Streptomyces sp. DT2A-34 TaxID=3051182 RepID=UPI00265C0049|nr:hypothetical protein [Streptomyces sp. DT2A-34]MDO0909340.1 hypothetical protein [Streptomyces sp. DT2A-34]
MSHSETVTCPSCESGGLLEGDEVVNVEINYPSTAGYGSEEEYDSHYLDDVSVTLTIGADYFSCPGCQLVLNSYDLISQAGLDTEFAVDGDVDEYVGQEPEYGND